MPLRENGPETQGSDRKGMEKPGVGHNGRKNGKSAFGLILEKHLRNRETLLSCFAYACHLQVSF
jgi:hypothetical protein